MDQTSEHTITFRCPPELEGILPRPIPAVLGLPDWFKELPQKAFSATLRDELFTIKKCPPVRRHDLRVPHATGVRPEGREWRIHLAT